MNSFKKITSGHQNVGPNGWNGLARSGHQYVPRKHVLSTWHMVGRRNGTIHLLIHTNSKHAHGVGSRGGLHIYLYTSVCAVWCVRVYKLINLPLTVIQLFTPWAVCVRNTVHVWLTQVESLSSLVVGHQHGSLWRLLTDERLNAVGNGIKLKVAVGEKNNTGA